MPPAAALAQLPWTWEPSVLAGLAGLTALYVLAVRQAGGRARVTAARQAAFHAGTLLAFVALVSPLDALADHDLFSAHMGQHMLLTFGAPPLWLLGVPRGAVERFLGGAGRRLAAWAANPVAAFLVFNGTMWAWHLPAAYQAALENESLHILEHLMFMGAAVVGWWPVLGPVPGGFRRPPRWERCLYLFGAALACTALAALITLAGRPLYPFYGARPLAWGFSPLADQQLGGLVMWLPGDMIFMLANLVILYRWLSPPARRTAPASA